MPCLYPSCKTIPLATFQKFSSCDNNYYWLLLFVVFVMFVAMKDMPVLAVNTCTHYFCSELVDIMLLSLLLWLLALLLLFLVVLAGNLDEEEGKRIHRES